MSEPYPVTTIARKWTREQEDMGSKPKFWYTDNDEKRWLFKFPTAKTGEHWAEKIAAEVAAAIGINHARVELARFEERRGSTTESFAVAEPSNTITPLDAIGSLDRHRPRSLYHGNQLLARIFGDYDPEKTFRNSSHTLENIWSALDRFFDDMSHRSKKTIAEYVVLDAVIGNTDRHHENWALLGRRVAKRWKWFVAPSYDHASSLGREISDDRRDKLLADERVGHYAERARGGIYWSEEDRRAPSPLELVRQAYDRYPSLFMPALRKLDGLNQDSMKDIVNRIPDDWMTPSSRVFALALMRYNMAELRKLTP